MSTLISVIVPVYNVASYLDECVRSILAQDHRELEVILVDDGSTDHSGAICDHWAAADDRVRVIHQKNGGAAAAKNAGLRAASGEYLSFVDSDDYLEPGVYSHMLGLLKQYDADVVQCAYRDVYRSYANERIHKRGREVVSTVDYFRMYTTDWTCALLWDKLYRREIFDGIFFEEGHKIDDEYFTYQGIMNANKIVCDDRIIYNYRKRRSSVMYSPKSAQQLLLDRVDFIGKRRKKIVVRFPELRRTFDLHFLEAMIYLRADPYFSPEAHNAVRRALSGYCREKGHTSVPLGWIIPLVNLYFGRISQTSLNEPVPAERDDFFD